jgi:hypothetical protein
MFWVIVVSVFFGMMVGTCLGVLVMSLMAMSSRASEPVHMDDRMWAP